MIFGAARRQQAAALRKSLSTNVKNFCRLRYIRLHKGLITHNIAEFAVLLWETLLYNRVTKEYCRKEGISCRKKSSD